MKPIKKMSITTGVDGLRYKVEVYIQEHADLEQYPEGVKAVFKLFRLDVNNENDSELLILIYNHKPFGFHSHDELPNNHNSRQPLHLVNWEEAWKVFQKKCQEILK